MCKLNRTSIATLFIAATLILSASPCEARENCGLIGRLIKRFRPAKEAPAPAPAPASAAVTPKPSQPIAAQGRSLLPVDGSLSKEQQLFRADYNSGKFDDKSRFVSFMRPGATDRASARIRSINPDGSLDVDAYVNGRFIKYRLEGEELASARTSNTARDNFSRHSEDAFTDRPHLEITSTTDTREAAFRRAYNAGQIDDEARYVSFEAERYFGDERIAARVESINSDGTVALSVQGPQGLKSLRLTREEAKSIRISDTAREAFGQSKPKGASAYGGSSPSEVREIFRGAPSHNGGIDDVRRAQFTKPVESPNRNMNMIFDIADREYARSQGRIFENVRASELPKNQRYTWVVLDDGSMVYGMITDGGEFGVKHVHLAAGRHVVAAGELAVNADGAVFNLLSGTYTVPILRDRQTSVLEMGTRVSKIFRNDFPKVNYTDDQLLNTGRLSAEDVRRLCASQIFRRNNSHYCN